MIRIVLRAFVALSAAFWISCTFVEASASTSSHLFTVRDSIEWGIYAPLRRQKKPVDLVYILGGQHILQKPLDRLASQQTNVDWFRFWLQGYADPDPSKVAQYHRWEAFQKL